MKVLLLGSSDAVTDLLLPLLCSSQVCELRKCLDASLQTMTSTAVEHPPGSTRSRMEKLLACEALGSVMQERMQGIGCMIESFVHEIQLLRTALEGSAARKASTALQAEIQGLRGLLDGSSVGGLSGGVFV